MGTVWVDAVEIGSFTDTHGEEGSILLDSAIIGTFGLNLSGYVYLGSTQIGTYTSTRNMFDRVITRLEKTSTPTKILADKSTVLADGAVIRADVFVPLFDRLTTRVEKV